MKAEKAKRLQQAGWRLGDTKDFLGLDASEAEFRGDQTKPGTTAP
jgi:hypothetical protein